jgi:polyhydroxybutyrate depolymerase
MMRTTTVVRLGISVSGLWFVACSGSPAGSGGDAAVSVGSSGASGSSGAGSSGASSSGSASSSGGASGSGGPSGVVDAGAQDAAAALDGEGLGSPDVSASDTGGPMPEPDAGSAPCTAGILRPGDSSVTIQHGGAARDYLLHVPASYTGKTRVPLLIDMHGSGQNATLQSMTSLWTRKADAMGFVVIYPNALNARWNAGTCCSPSMEQNVDDLGFLRAVVEKTTTDGCIDRTRVYASGLSGGGLMAYRLACMAADMFAAIAPVSGADVTIPCTPSGPVSVASFRGLMDTTVPYDGGMPLRWLWPSAKADFDQFSQLDRCTGPTTASHGVCQTKSQCAGGADVTLCSINGGHVLYAAAASEGAAVPDVAWEIFQRHSLP